MKHDGIILECGKKNFLEVKTSEKRETNKTVACGHKMLVLMRLEGVQTAASIDIWILLPPSLSTKMQ